MTDSVKKEHFLSSLLNSFILRVLYIRTPYIIALARKGSIGILTKNLPIVVIFYDSSRHPIILSTSVDVFIPYSSGF